MSIMSVKLIMERIAIATPNSPIAVFRYGKSKYLNAMFGSTVRTMQQIRNGDPDLIGIYDKTMNAHEIELELMRVTRPR